MGEPTRYFVVPTGNWTEEKPDIQVAFPWQGGCAFMVVVFFVVGIVDSAVTRGASATSLTLLGLFYASEVAVVLLTIALYLSRRSGAIRDWKRRQMAAADRDARSLTERAQNLAGGFYSSLTELPRLLHKVDTFLAQADYEFRDKAYAPFWDNIEQAAVSLGAFNSTLARLSANGASYAELLARQLHNFPPIEVQHGALPDPAQQMDRLRQLVRAGQRDFEFATIWEHRKTQKVLLEGFRTLGEAVGNLSSVVEGSFERLNSTIEENAARQLNEQAHLRQSFESAVDKWEEQKRLNGFT